MFGLGLPEIAVILLVAVLVFGPDKLPEFARTTGRAVNAMRKLIADAKEQISEEIGADVIEEFSALDPRKAQAAPRPMKAPLNPDEKPPFDTEAT